MYKDEVYPSTEPIDADPSPTPELRALYDGDISSSILEKLSSYYIEHSEGLDKDDYFIVRQSQYDYVLYYGEIGSQGYITDATVVHYTGYQAQQFGGTVYRLSVSEAASGAVDLSGPSGYIYSSYDSYLPSPYITTGKSAHNTGLWVSVLSCLLICAVVGVIVWRWLNAYNK